MIWPPAVAPRLHGGPDALGVPRFDFSTNSNACGPCPMALAAVQQADARHYPDASYTALRAQLAAFHGVDVSRVVLVGSASEFIFRMTAHVVQQGGRRVSLPAHAYGDYAQAAQAWGLTGAATPQEAQLVWACEPSSPLGGALVDWPVGPITAPLVLDRAYEPLRLSGQPSLTDDQLAQVWQLWTPNKALGLTGVRAAYVIAPLGSDETVAALERLCPSWPVGAHGVAMLHAWVQPPVQAWRAGSLRTLRDWKARQIKLLQTRGWHCLPSEANFFCARPPPGFDPTPLRGAGIKLRDATSFGLPGHVRLGVLPPDAQDALALALLGRDPLEALAYGPPALNWVSLPTPHSNDTLLTQPQKMTTPQTLDDLRHEAALGNCENFEQFLKRVPDVSGPSAKPPMTAQCIMVLGTTSGAGKSWLTTALCRYYARQGLKVVPFKAQNMSNNARVVASGNGQGEIGSAQYFQSLAARAVPDVRMNPLLLKPERDTHSQVVLMGQVDEALSAMAWRGRSASVWPVIAQALDDLRAENDVVVIEGAGSPAEINLHSSDIVNMRVALHAQAACLLVTDIDRGGAFAHLYGTWALLPAHERALIKGYVLNKFRGDASLLAPAPQMLESLTGVPTVATLPMWWQHGLPEEDGMFDDRSLVQGAVTLTVAVIAYPRISNLDEFQPLKNIPGVRLQWVRSPAELAGLAASDWLILPGSKHTSGDLAWLRKQGLDAAIARHAGQGGAVLGICGGLQMLGEALIDPHGIDGNAPGLGLLPLVTVFEADKTVRHTHTRFHADTVGPWAALAGVPVAGYEIHHGQTQQHPAMATAGDVARVVMPDGLAWQNGAGNVLGLYLHGLFEDPAALQALFAARLAGPVPTLDAVFDGLADYITAHFEPGILQSLLD